MIKEAARERRGSSVTIQRKRNFPAGDWLRESTTGKYEAVSIRYTDWKELASLFSSVRVHRSSKPQCFRA